MKVEDEGYKYSVEKLISALISAYFTVNVITLLSHINDKVYYTDLGFLQNGDFSALTSQIIYIILAAGVITLLDFAFPRIRSIPYVMLLSSTVLGGILLAKADTNKDYMYLIVLGIMCIVVLYTSQKGCFDFLPSEFHKGFLWGGVGLLTLFFGFFIACIGIFRYLTYSTPNYDFGIWCNMFYNMTEHGVPTVSCERDMLLSHFAVHFSPIYYVMLPFYFVLRSPITLQVLQVIVLYSGIVPLVLLAKKKGISSRVILVLSAIYASFPAIGAGTFYDLHENCFLLPLLLWVFFFYESKKYIPMSVFCILTLLVKEDAFIYLIFFAIYVLISDKNWKISIPTALVALSYFLVVSSLMSKYGDGIMVNRFDSLIYNADDGLLGAVKTVILNPGYALKILVTPTKSADKFIYLVHLLAPLGFIPFATKKVSRFLLLTPLLLNTLTLYQYQPNITFQYSFGIIAFLFYITVLNVSELSGFTKKYMLSVATIASVLLFVMICIPKFGTYVGRYNDYKDTYDRLDTAIAEQIPDDASVSASSFLIPRLYEREHIYEVKYHKDENGAYKTDTRYVVLDMRYADESNKAYDFYIENGYELVYEDEGLIKILKKIT